MELKNSTYSEIEGLVKIAGEVRGVPDGSGPFGRGAGPGKGSKSGIGLIIMKQKRGEKLTAGEQAQLDAYNASNE